MSFAVIKTGGKQYVIREGETLKVEKLPEAKNGKVVFDDVLLVDDGKKTVVGTPNIPGQKVEADFVEEGRNRKITVIKYKNKTGYRRKAGHRQHYTKVAIKKI